jgi:hypothetical protein
MALTYKILGQSIPATATPSDIYTVGAGKSTVVSSIDICNQAASSATYRIAARPAGATLASVHYLAYDAIVPANDTVSLTVGVTLATTDVVTVQSSTGTVSFSLFGSEIS